MENLEVRNLKREDAEIISRAFSDMGWNKPASLYLGYFEEQTAGRRQVMVAFWSGVFCGYINLIWRSEHFSKNGKNIPEIQDFNVLAKFRGRGIGNHLMGLAEESAAKLSDVVGIGVGLHLGYGPAQRMYVKRGYIPDGQGVFYKGRQPVEGAALANDDDLILYFTKVLKQSRVSK